MPGLVIAPRARIFHGHEWIYGTEVRKTFGNPQPGDVVTLKDFRDRPLGSAIYNPASQIVARRFSRRRQDLDQRLLSTAGSNSRSSCVAASGSTTPSVDSSGASPTASRG